MKITDLLGLFMYEAEANSMKELVEKAISEKIELRYFCLVYADLGYSNFKDGKFIGCDFGEANLNYANYKDAKLINCDFSYADLNEADFTDADIENCNFYGAKNLDKAIGLDLDKINEGD